MRRRIAALASVEEDDDDWISKIPISHSIPEPIGESRKSKSSQWSYDDKYFKHAKRIDVTYVFKRNDVVCFTRYFLQCIGCGQTNDMWCQTGIVTEDEKNDSPYIKVEWNKNEVSLVNKSNLALAKGKLFARSRVE